MPEGLTPELYSQLQDAMAQYNQGQQPSQQPVQQDQSAVAAPGSAVQALIQMPGQLQPPQPAAPNPVGGQPYGGGTPDQQLSSNPTQATADTLNILDRQKNLTGQQGDAEAEGLQGEADVENAASAETQQQAKDFNELQQQNLADLEAQHSRRLQALDTFRAQNLKDPSSQFWEDKGQGSRITAALGAFASGLGGGLTGQGGNKFLDFLHSEMDNNFNAHKENIDNMYKAAVEEGKIEDNVENKNRFRNQAKLQSFELQSAHIKHDLNAVKSSSASKVAKIAADKAIAGLDQEGVKARSDLAAILAKQGVGNLAAQRARQKEIRDAFFKQVDLHNKDMGEDESRTAAIADLKGAGYNNSELAPLMSGLGITANPKTGEFDLKQNNTTEAETSEPHYDDNRKLVVPTKTAQGKRIDPKEIATLTKDLTEKTADVDGKPQIFRTKEDAEAMKAIPDAERLHAVMLKAWKEGDAGTYNQAADQFVEMAPKLLGYRRSPSEGQAGITRSSDTDAEDRATIRGQLPKFEIANRFGIPGFPVSQWEQAHLHNRNLLGQTNSAAGQALNKLDGVGTTISGMKQDLLHNISSPYKAGKTPEEKTKELDELTKKLGGR